MRTLVVFEDNAANAFDVLTRVRGVFDLRCGAQTLIERTASRLEHDRLVLLVPEQRADLVAETHPNSTVGWDSASRSQDDASDFVFVNGRLLALGNDLDALLQRAARARGDGPAGALVCDRDLIIAHTDAASAANLAKALRADADESNSSDALPRALAGYAHALTSLNEVASDGSVLLEHVWELVQHNGAALVDDFVVGPGAGVSVGARIDPGVHLMNDRNIRIEAGVRLRPGVVLDAEEGPITLAAGVDVQPQVVVRGPAWIGPGCLVKAGAKIHENTSIGPVCKVGGEIEGSILQAYSNKQHEGFLGHAFLAEWVNLGADTNNSDLKNNYGSVRMWEAGQWVDTGTLFMGLIAADHVKSAINTQFNTGTVAGFSSQVFGAGFPPKYIPPFAWGVSGDTYDLERALQTASTVMARRKCDLTPAYETAFRRTFEAAREAREKALANRDDSIPR